jgi:hypothetical protein
MNQNKLTINETKYLRILAKKHILLPTKFKKPLVKDWNKYYAETKTINQLLTLNQEYSLRTGKLIGARYYFIAIDLDDIWAKERIKDSRYIETNKGIHRYLLIKELPKSCWLVNKDGSKIGEIHSLGRFVVGIGSLHEQGTRYTLKGRVNEKWCLKFEKLTELQSFLTARNIFTTPWGKTGQENIRNLALFQPKTKTKKLSNQQNFYQKKQKLEAKINDHPQKDKLNICYICLTYFKKDHQIIKAHLQGKQHQKKWKIFQNKKFSEK